MWESVSAPDPPRKAEDIGDANAPFEVTLELNSKQGVSSAAQTSGPSGLPIGLPGGGFGFGSKQRGDLCGPGLFPKFP